MNAPTYERLRRLFLQAHDAPPGRIADLLDQTEKADPELAAEVRQLLTQAGAASATLEASAVGRQLRAMAEGLLDRHGESPPPATVGPYRVLSVLGHGAFAGVYLAEQDAPVRRVVAVKLLHMHVSSRAAALRFQIEQQALASLQHPGIATLFDAGMTEGGRPYLAMEYVDGAPLCDYCRREALSVGARIELLARVCDAVHHAHQKGIIHRDLKPAHILVAEQEATKPRSHEATEVALSSPIPFVAPWLRGSVAASAQPKIIDFGIAKVVSELGGVAGAARTLTGQLMGTLAYMSPEQTLGRADTRSDVYALGAVLYELLAGRRCFELDGEAIAAAARRIQDEPPPRLSRIDRDLGGDIEAIVNKALEKDPARRYASADALAADLRRYLRHEPILARPAGAAYVLSRLARRHRGVVAGAAVGLLALVAAAAIAWAGMLYARAAEQESREFAIFLARETLPRLDEIAGTDAVRDELAQRCYEESHRLLQRRPNDAYLLDVQAGALRHKSASAFRAGRLTEALERRAQALETRRRAEALAPEDPSILGALSIDLVLLGDALCALERRAEGWRLYEEAASIHERLVESSRSATHLEYLAWSHQRLSFAAFQRGDISGTEAHSGACLRLSREWVEREPENVLAIHALRAAHAACAWSADARGRRDLARDHVEQALPLARAVVAAEPARPPFVLDCVVLLLGSGDRADDSGLAEDAFEEARLLLDSLVRLGMRDAIVGSLQVGVLARLALSAVNAGRVADANRLIDEALALREFFGGPPTDRLQRAADLHWQVGQVLWRLDRRAESEEHLNTALALQERVTFVPGADVQRLWNLLSMRTAPELGCDSDPEETSRLAELAYSRTAHLTAEQEQLLDAIVWVRPRMPPAE